MDSPVATRFLRHLLRHGRCPLTQNRARLAEALLQSRTVVHRRQYASGGRRDGQKPEAIWQQRHAFPPDRTAEYREYPMVTADELRLRRKRPRKVKMLMRDFIEDSLYNPHYGYFAKQVVIFTPGEPFDFPSLRDEPAFYAELGRRYTAFEDELDAAAAAAATAATAPSRKWPAARPHQPALPPDHDVDEAEAGTAADTRQLWHTPTELFRPHYGEAVARYLVTNYLLGGTYPHHDLVIYELGAGRGTMMLNVLDHMRAAEPAVYARTRYRIVEISAQLARLQREAALRAGHADRVEVVNRSVFDWHGPPEPSPCFVLAFEVFDNFAHDLVRYDPATGRPSQAVVLIDDQGDFHEFYEPRLDPVADRFLAVRQAATGGKYALPYATHPLARWWANRKTAAGTAKLSRPEYLPTRLMQFFEVLERSFPVHRLLTSDFHALPTDVPGLNAPLVQTRFRRRTVPVTTPLVHQGYFDILFPTDFPVMEAMYQAITGKLSRVATHGDFMRQWAYVEETETQSGENPLLSWYKNASVMYSV